jgi:acyl carrier protein
MRNEVVDALRSHILADFIPDESPEVLTPETPLFDAGILDSVAALDLIEFIEERFGVALEAHELSVETFGTLDAIAALVLEKSSAP